MDNFLNWLILGIYAIAAIVGIFAFTYILLGGLQ